MHQLRRRLPNVWAEGKHQFVMWHLYGSLPHALYLPTNKQNAGQAFVWNGPISRLSTERAIGAYFHAEGDVGRPGAFRHYPHEEQAICDLYANRNESQFQTLVTRVS